MSEEKQLQQDNNMSEVEHEEKGSGIQNLLSKNPIRKDVITLAWPILIELLLGSLFGMVDMMMLGWIADKARSAASVAAVDRKSVV